MRLHLLLLPILLVVSSLGFAQNSNEKMSNQNNYLVFDASKSLAANIDHDRMYFLRVNSENIEIPSEFHSFLESSSDPEEFRSKYKWSRVSALRVMYNPKISKEDKLFFCKKILDKKSIEYAPIQSLMEDFLKYN